MRLDLALIRRHPELSRRKAREVIEKGQVTVGGEVALEAGKDVADTAAISWDAGRKARRRARCSLPLLYEDDRLLIVDKPAGLLTVPTSSEIRDEDTALARVRDYVRHLRPRDPYVGVVHRIDRETSGAVAFALDRPTRHALIQLVSRHQIARRYLALVLGEPSLDRGRIDAPIGDAYEGRRRIARSGEPAREARTRFEVRERFGAVSLVALELETGRQHQIRLHLAEMGHPVLGDRVYGFGSSGSTDSIGRASLGGIPSRSRAGSGGGSAPPHGGTRIYEGRRVKIRAPRVMLHAESLALTHPWTREPVTARSPLPADFEGLLRVLRSGS